MPIRRSRRGWPSGPTGSVLLTYRIFRAEKFIGIGILRTGRPLGHVSNWPRLVHGTWLLPLPSRLQTIESAIPMARAPRSRKLLPKCACETDTGSWAPHDERLRFEDAHVRTFSVLRRGRRRRDARPFSMPHASFVAAIATVAMVVRVSRGGG